MGRTFPRDADVFLALQRVAVLNVVVEVVVVIQLVTCQHPPLHPAMVQPVLQIPIDGEAGASLSAQKGMVFDGRLPNVPTELALSHLARS